MEFPPEVEVGIDERNQESREKSTHETTLSIKKLSKSQEKMTTVRLKKKERKHALE